MTGVQTCALPIFLIRWAAALALVLSLRALYKSGASAFSRKSVVIWLLAVLLHGPAVASRAGIVVNFNALPEAAATLVVETTAVAGAFLLALAVISAVLRAGRAPIFRAWAPVTLLGGPAHLTDGYQTVVSARPPPRLA